MNLQLISPVRHGLIMGILALIFGALWAAYLATHHEQLHGAFETQQQEIQQQHQQEMTQGMSMDNMGEMHGGHSHDEATHAPHTAGGHEQAAQHSHSGSLANDAMQRLLRGHIHAMGLGVLVCVLLLVTTLTTIKDCWKKTLGFTFGLGALLYPPAWVIMGFRTVEFGPQAAEASIMWLFAPAVGLLLASMVALFAILLIEGLDMNRSSLLAKFFNNET